MHAPGVEMVFWRHLREAVEALVELTPGGCGPRCEGRHSIVAADERGRIRSRSFGPPPDDPLLTHRRARLAEARARLAEARTASRDPKAGHCVETQSTDRRTDR